MARRKIVWSFEAKIEYFEILDFYKQRNGNVVYSRKLHRQIKKSILYIKSNPFIGVASNSKDIRVLIENVFLIYYSVSDTQIKILSIADSRQNPDQMKYKK